jgi:hypothetical protein
MTDFRANNKFKQQKKACFEAKSGSRKNSFAFPFLFEKINSLKRQMPLNPEKSPSNNKRKAESLLFFYTEIDQW